MWASFKGSIKQWAPNCAVVYGIVLNSTGCILGAEVMGMAEGFDFALEKIPGINCFFNAKRSYYYGQHERRIDRDFIGGHRFFGGAEFAVVETRRFSRDQRVLIECFLSDAAPDFNRYRLRSRLSVRGVVAPYTFYEFFVGALGWRSRLGGAWVNGIHSLTTVVVVDRPWVAITGLFSEHAVFLAQVFNSAQLGLVRPARQGDRQKTERARQHGVNSPAEPDPRPA